jgi:hypothetical protein
MAFCNTLAFISEGSAQSTGKSVEVRDLPQGEGAYYQGPTGFIQLQHLLSYGKGLTQRVRTVIPTLTPQGLRKFKGAEAPVKIQEDKPTFLLRGNPLVGGGSIRDVVLARLDKKKDHRDLPVTSGSTLFTVRQVLPKDHTPEISVTPVAGTVFKLAPAQPLLPGQYLITFGDGEVGGFDFEIDPMSPTKH